MKKVIRLTESDLMRIVKRVIKEQDTNPQDDKPDFLKRTATTLKKGIKHGLTDLKNLLDKTGIHRSGNFDYNYIENYATPNELREMLYKISDDVSTADRDDDFFYNVPEAVVESFFIGFKNAILKKKIGCKEMSNWREQSQEIYENLINFGMDPTKVYHKQSIASSLSEMKKFCKIE